MSFVAAIDDLRNILKWCRCCVSLAGVSDQIIVTFTLSSLSIQAMNSSKTTHGVMTFAGPFFKEFTYDTAHILQDCVQKTGGSLAKLSFVVSSKHLVMLFKNLQASSLNYICLNVDCASDTPRIRRYKLNVEIYTKKLILKKYQVNYQPVSIDDISIFQQYDALLEESQINHLVIDNTILKLFIDMVPTPTEDLKIEVKLTKINFCAYTKQVLKDRDYLKQPMLVTISMAVEELEDTTLGEVTVSLSLRLRDFRNFVNLLSGLRSDASQDANSGDATTELSALFKEPGDPIVLQYKGLDLVIQFIQMTTTDNESRSENSKLKFALRAPILKQRSEMPIEPLPEHSSVVQSSSHAPLPPGPQDSLLGISLENYESMRGPEITIAQHRDPLPSEASRFQNGFGSNRRSRPGELTDDSSDGEATLEFGPTQPHKKPKSLFD